MRAKKINVATILLIDLVLLLMIIHRPKFNQADFTSHANYNLMVREIKDSSLNYSEGVNMDSLALNRHIVGLQ